MERKLICKEWLEQTNFIYSYKLVSENMLYVDGILKKAESCCIMNGLPGIGYVDKTGLIDEWYEILERLIDVVENGVYDYISKNIDEPFKDKMDSIYNRMLSISLENYTTENTLHFIDLSYSYTGPGEKDSITIKDLLSLTQSASPTSYDVSLENLTGIYQEQYGNFKATYGNIKFEDFMAVNCGFNGSEAWNPDPHMALQMAGMYPGAGAAPDIADGVLYMTEGEYLNAAWSFVCVLPLGQLVRGAGWVIKGEKAAEEAAKAAKALKATRGVRFVKTTFKQSKVLSEGLNASLDVVRKKADDVVKGLDSSLKNIDDFINGNKTFDEVLEDYAKVYSENINANKPWSWDDSLPGGENLTSKQKSIIKQQAIDNGLIPKIEVKKVDGMKYGFADFEAAGVVKETVIMPEEMWKLSDAEQFKWLDEQIGGKVEGYTWHHSEISGKMELVPTGIHNITTHNGGRTPGMWADAKR